MKFIFVTPEFVTEPYFSGGIANYYYKIGKILISRGHDVAVLVKSNEDPATLNFDSIKVIRFRPTRLGKLLKKISSSNWYSFLDKLDASYSAMRSLRSLKYRQCLVEIANYEFLGLIPVMLLNNRRFVTRIQSSRPHWDRCSKNKVTFPRKLQWALEYLQVLLSRNNQTTSNLMKEIYESYLPMKEIKVLKRPVLEEQINIERYDILLKIKEKPYILYFGRLQYNKGVVILAIALNKFFKKYDDVYCVFIGNDSLTENNLMMKERIKSISKRFENRLLFFPSQKYEFLYPVIKNAAFIVLPSCIENASNVQFEAMSLGKVVLGSTKSSFDEVIIDNINGFLFKNGDPEDLAKKMIEIYQRNDLNEIGRRAKETMEKDYNQDLVINEILKYYQRIL